MSQTTIHGPGGADEDSPGEDAIGGGQTFASAQNADAILDEIDDVLASNADTFVRSFVQKGGQ